MAQPLHRELHIRHTKIYAVLTGIQLHRPARVGTCRRAEAANIADVEFLRLPGLQARVHRARCRKSVPRVHRGERSESLEPYPPTQYRDRPTWRKFHPGFSKSQS